MALSKAQEDKLKEKIEKWWKQAEEQPGGDAGPLSVQFAAALEKNKADLRIKEKDPKNIDEKKIDADARIRTKGKSLENIQNTYIKAVNDLENGVPPSPSVSQLLGGGLAGAAGDQALSMGKSFLGNILGSLPFVGGFLSTFIDKLLPMAIKAVTVGVEAYNQKPGADGKNEGFFDRFSAGWVKDNQRNAMKQALGGLNLPEIQLKTVIDDVLLNTPAAGTTPAGGPPLGYLPPPFPGGHPPLPLKPPGPNVGSSPA